LNEGIKGKTMNLTLKRVILLTFSLTLVMVTPVHVDGVGVNAGEWAKYGIFS